MRPTQEAQALLRVELRKRGTEAAEERMNRQQAGPLALGAVRRVKEAPRGATVQYRAS